MLTANKLLTPIGIFDSGIGGLSVVKEVIKLLPCESICYLADHKNFPYGDKTPEEIIQISKNNVEWLLNRKAKIIVIACNTATVSAISYLRKYLPNIQFVGMEPAVKPAGIIAKKGVAILSSPKATKSPKLINLIENNIRHGAAFNIGSLGLVKTVEKQATYSEILDILAKDLPLDILNKIDVLVLGCTHFPLVKEQIQKYVGPKITVIDSGEAVAKRVKLVLDSEYALATSGNPIYEFYTTGTESKKFGDFYFKPI